MRITYAHCVDDTEKLGYVFREVDVVVWEHAPDHRLGETSPTYSVKIGETSWGVGDTMEEAIGDARYRLMADSRDVFYATRKRREHIPSGYRAYTGKILSDSQVAAYNRIQDTINRWLDDGREPPESLLDESHQYFALVATL